jgi:hypothetical protein
MLMHHADAGPDGCLGVPECDGISFEEDLAAGGLVHAVENLHQGGFFQRRSPLKQRGFPLAVR